MSIDLGGTAADAWALWRRDRAVLLPMTGLFVFLPTLALLLLLPAQPVPPEAAGDAAAAALFTSRLRGWIIANSGPLAAAWLVSLFGSLAVTGFYLDRASATVGAMLTRTLALLPRYALASLLLAIPLAIGFVLLIVPMLYVLGRTILVAPVLVAEQPLSATGAIARALALSRRQGLVLAGVVTIALVAQQLMPAPLIAIAEGMRRINVDNPVVISVLAAGAAAMAAAVSLGFILFKVALYRRLA